MARGRNGAVRIAAMLALSGLPAIAGEHQLPSRGERWLDAVSPHFLLLSNAPDQDTVRVATELERFHAVLGQLFGRALK